MSKEAKKNLIYTGAGHFRLLGFYYDEESPDQYCMQGQGGCETITKDVYNKIAKKYNITDKFEDLYSDNHVVGDTVYIINGGRTGPFYNITHMGIEVKREGEYIVLEEKVATFPEGELANYKSVIIKYTFNKLDDGYYALYSIDY